MRIRDFSGSSQELATFMQFAWSKRSADKNFRVHWDETYLRWQLFANPNPVYRIAAYDADQLVGFFGAEEFHFQTLVGITRGTMGSWLTVHPDYRREGVARLLHDAMWERHRERNAKFQIGYVNAGALSGDGRPFWREMSPNAQLRRSPRFWACVFDGHGVAAATGIGPWQEAGIQIVALVQRLSLKRSNVLSIRNYQEDDLQSCLRLVSSAADVDFGYIWNSDRLAHQLSFEGVPKTLVLEIGDTMRALINYHHLKIVGLQTLSCAVVDFIIASDVALPQLATFLRFSLIKMSEEGAQVAVTLGPPVHAARILLASGMLPAPTFQQWIYCPVDEATRFPACRTMHIHCR